MYVYIYIQYYIIFIIYIHWSFSSAYYYDNISSGMTYSLILKRDLCFYWPEMTLQAIVLGNLLWSAGLKCLLLLFFVQCVSYYFLFKSGETRFLDFW